MTSYIAHHTKKKQILGRKEDALRRLIDRGAAPSELKAAAASVRGARIRVLRALRAQIVPTNDADVQYAKIDNKIRATLSSSLIEILAEFGYMVEDTGFHSSDD